MDEIAYFFGYGLGLGLPVVLLLWLLFDSLQPLRPEDWNDINRYY